MKNRNIIVCILLLSIVLSMMGCTESENDTSGQGNIKQEMKTDSQSEIDAALITLIKVFNGEGSEREVKSVLPAEMWDVVEYGSECNFSQIMNLYNDYAQWVEQNDVAVTIQLGTKREKIDTEMIDYMNLCLIEEYEHIERLDESVFEKGYISEGYRMDGILSMDYDGESERFDYEDDDTVALRIGDKWYFADWDGYDDIEWYGFNLAGMIAVW